MVGTQPRVERQAPARRPLGRRQRRAVGFYLFILPWLVGFVLLGIVPLVVGGLTSLTNYDGLNLETVKFVGTRNYARILTDQDALWSFNRTVLWALVNVPLWLVVSFGVALLLNKPVRGSSVFRTIFYLPSVVPVVATIWIWRIFLDRNYGLLNGIISLAEPGTAVAWLSDYALPSLSAISLWGGLGGGMVIFLAGLQEIPAELEEAARIDGAGGLDVLRYITLPLLTPIIFFQLVLGIIGATQQLIMPLLLSTSTGTVSMPPRDVYLVMVHIYFQIFGNQRFGYGMALLWILVVAIVALTVVVFRTARYWVHYEVQAEGESR